MAPTTRRRAAGEPGAAAPAAAAPVRRQAPSALARLLLHAVIAALFFYVFTWHFTSAADPLPGKYGFGRHWRYLTFCVFSLQTLFVWPLALASDAAALLGRKPGALARAADLLACTALPMSSVVTLLYYSMKFAGLALVEGSGKRPFWHGPSLHVANSVAAWVDLAACDRSFGWESRLLTFAAVPSYLAWLLVVRRAHGSYPYPFLNAAPHPWTVAAIAVASLPLAGSLWGIGRWAAQLRRAALRVGRTSGRGGRGR